MGLQLALAHMRKGERAAVYVTDPAYGYGKQVGGEGRGRGGEGGRGSAAWVRLLRPSPSSCRPPAPGAAARRCAQRAAQQCDGAGACTAAPPRPAGQLQLPQRASVGAAGVRRAAAGVGAARRGGGWTDVGQGELRAMRHRAGLAAAPLTGCLWLLLGVAGGASQCAHAVPTMHERRCCHARHASPRCATLCGRPRSLSAPPLPRCAAQKLDRRAMLFEERLEAAERRRGEGNALFQEGKLTEALGKYAMVGRARRGRRAMARMRTGQRSPAGVRRRGPPPNRQAARPDGGRAGGWERGGGGDWGASEPGSRGCVRQLVGMSKAAARVRQQGGARGATATSLNSPPPQPRPCIRITPHSPCSPPLRPAQALSYTDEDFCLQLEGPHLDKADAVMLPVYLNMAAVHLKLGDNAAALQSCAQVRAPRR